MRKALFAIAFALPLAACGGAEKRVEGWASLKTSLCNEASESFDEAACARIELYDLLGEVRELQEIKDTLFANPTIPQDVKDKVNIAEKQAVVALRAYTDAVVSGVPVSDATLQTALVALTAFQQILIDLANEEGLQ